MRKTFPTPTDRDITDAREIVASGNIAYGEALRKGESSQEHVAAVAQGIAYGRANP